MSKNYLFSKMYDSSNDMKAIVWHYSVISLCNEMSMAVVLNLFSITPPLK